MQSNWRSDAKQMRSKAGKAKLTSSEGLSLACSVAVCTPQEYLSALPRTLLVARCEAEGCCKTGTKPKLIQAILEARNQPYSHPHVKEQRTPPSSPMKDSSPSTKNKCSSPRSGTTQLTSLTDLKGLSPDLKKARESKAPSPKKAASTVSPDLKKARDSDSPSPKKAASGVSAEATPPFSSVQQGILPSRRPSFLVVVFVSRKSLSVVTFQFEPAVLQGGFAIMMVM